MYTLDLTKGKAMILPPSCHSQLQLSTRKLQRSKPRRSYSRKVPSSPPNVLLLFYICGELGVSDNARFEGRKESRASKLVVSRSEVHNGKPQEQYAWKHSDEMMQKHDEKTKHSFCYRG